jgi:MarR-like DNA-binding transcriptional regulator SgrR of sgrS sRNA
MALATEYSIGFYAPAFPRDPINVNVYLEHVLLGQSIEPLFTLGDDGLITGAVAEKWDFNKDRTEIIIHIRKGLLFSNGQPLTSADIKFSLERHRQNQVSQSYNYLKVIKQIEIIDKMTIKVVLHHQYIPILLTLSRDHLGILPNNWKFDSQSKEPYMGTGPYKIIKENDIWQLVENPYYRNQLDIKIKKWQVDIIDTIKNIFPKKPSDLLILTSKPTRLNLLKRYENFEQSHQEIKSFSFMQSSFWWINEKYSSHSLAERKQIKAAIDILSELMTQSMGGDLSTGIIPVGITGAIAERSKRDSLVKQKNSIHLIIPDWLVEPMSTQIKNCTEFKENNVNFELSSYTPQEISKVKESKADIVLISYAGGFFDPEGYLVVLPSMIGRSTKELFGDKSEAIRIKATAEVDGHIRANLYREFSYTAQEELRYFPGWAPTFSEFRSSKIVKKSTAFKYSYKLIDYQNK